MSTFSERLLQLRIKSGCNQEQFAKMLNVSRRAYQYYESGDKFPNVNTLIELADFFDVSVDYLLGRTDDPSRH